MVFNSKGYKYSISEKGSNNDFVVAKFSINEDGDAVQVIEARIIDAGSQKKVRNIIENGSYNKYPLLDGSQPVIEHVN